MEFGNIFGIVENVNIVVVRVVQAFAYWHQWKRKTVPYCLRREKKVLTCKLKDIKVLGASEYWYLDSTIQYLTILYAGRAQYENPFFKSQ